jgi:hypothetical protein
LGKTGTLVVQLRQNAIDVKRGRHHGLQNNLPHREFFDRRRGFSWGLSTYTSPAELVSILIAQFRKVISPWEKSLNTQPASKSFAFRHFPSTFIGVAHE